MQKHAIELHEERHHRVANVDQVDHVIAESEQHDGMVHAHDPLDFEVAVGVNVVKVIQKVAAREGQQQISVPGDEAEQVAKEVATATGHDAHEPHGAQHRVNEAHMQVSVRPRSELDFATALQGFSLRARLRVAVVGLLFGTTLCVVLERLSLKALKLASFVPLVGLHRNELVVALIDQRVDYQVD